MMRKTLFWTAAAAAMIGGLAPTALAQGASGEAAKSATSEDIIVTARKKEETLLTAPVAVSAFNEQAIENLDIQSVDDVARFTPGLSFAKAFGRTTDRPVVRGQANILAGVQAGVEAGAAFFVDGVYYAGDIQSLDLGDVTRVEVIKGPQSALYGRNTYSGAINFITKSPGDTFSASASASAASDDEYNVNARVAGPITETLSGSISGRYYTFGGQWTNAATREALGEEESKSVAGTLYWEPSSSFSLRGRLSYAEDRDGPRAFGIQKSDLNNCFPGYRSNAFRGASATTNNNPNQYFCGVIKDSGVYNQNTGANGTIPGAPFMGVDRDLLTGSLIGTVELPTGHTVTGQIGYRNEIRATGSDSDFQNAFSPFTPATNPPTSNGLFQLSSRDKTWDYSTEVRVESPADRRLRWMIGAYAYEQSVRNQPFNFAYPVSVGRTGPVTSFNGTNNSAVFGRVSFDITPKLTVDAEVRKAKETKTAEEYGNDIQPFSATNRPAGTVTYSDKRDFDATTPRFTLTYKPVEGTTFYGIYAKGAKPGGLNALIGLLNNRATYEQEESKNYELGWKQSLFEGKGYFTLAAFYTEATDYQLTTSVQDTTGASTTGLTSLVTNQGEAEIKGVEADFRMQLTDHLDIGANYAWTDPEFTKGCDEFQYTLTSGGRLLAPVAGGGIPTPPGVGVALGVTQPAGLTLLPGNCSIVGKKVPLTSEHQASVNVNYERPIGGGGLSMYARADATYESSKFIQVHNLAETGEATVVGARLGLKGERWEVGVFGRNLTDEDAIPIATRWFDLFQGSATAAGATTAQQTGLDTGSPRGFFYSPRKKSQVGVELKVKY